MTSEAKGVIFDVCPCGMLVCHTITGHDSHSFCAGPQLFWPYLGLHGAQHRYDCTITDLTESSMVLVQSAKSIDTNLLTLDRQSLRSDFTCIQLIPTVLNNDNKYTRGTPERALLRNDSR